MTNTNEEMEKIAEEFWKQAEQEAEKLEVTVDYYLAEFYWWMSKQG